MRQLDPATQHLSIEANRAPHTPNVLVTFDLSVSRSTPTAAVILQVPAARGGWRLRWRISRTTSMADLVVAPSTVVRDTLTQLLRVRAAKIVMAPPMLVHSTRATLREVSAARERAQAPARYVLAADDGPEIGGLPQIKWPAGIAQAERCALVSGAVALVDRSSNDGVAFAVHEALAGGTPVIVARGSAGEEAMRGAGIAVDPSNRGGFRSAVELLADNSGLRSGLSRRALEVAAGFLDSARLSGLSAALDRLQPAAAEAAGSRGEPRSQVNKVRDRR
jgi:hypothetical protein